MLRWEARTNVKGREKIAVVNASLIDNMIRPEILEFRHPGKSLV